jgi:hypothetical protein
LALGVKRLIAAELTQHFFPRGHLDTRNSTEVTSIEGSIAFKLGVGVNRDVELQSVIEV